MNKNASKPRIRDYVGRLVNVLLTTVAAVLVALTVMTSITMSLDAGEPLPENIYWGSALIVGGLTVTRLLAGLAAWILINGSGWRLGAILFEGVVIAASGAFFVSIGIGISGASWLTVTFAGIAVVAQLAQDWITLPNKR